MKNQFRLIRKATEIFLQETAALITESNVTLDATFQSHTGQFGYLVISRLVLSTLCHLNLEVDRVIWYKEHE